MYNKMNKSYIYWVIFSPYITLLNILQNIYKMKNLRVVLLYINSTTQYTNVNTLQQLKTEVAKSTSLNSNETENKVETWSRMVENCTDETEEQPRATKET